MAFDRNALLQARTKAGLSQKALAAKAKVSQQLIGALEKGTVSHTKHIYAIARALEVGPERLDPAVAEAIEKAAEELTDLSYETHPYHPEPAQKRIERPFPPVPGPRPDGSTVPIYGVRPALASDGFDAFISNEPLERLDWRADGRFGFYAPNDSLGPRIASGDTVILQFGRPIKKGAYVVLFDAIPLGEASAPGYARRIAVGVVVSWTDDQWILQKTNPDKTFKMSRQEWPFPVFVTGVLFG